MNHLHTGQFYGQTNKTINLDGITLTDTEYTHDKVDWHYHENAYFTFILQGNVIEGNKKEVYNCSAGELLFHHWQEPHYNIKPKGFTRGFHIELDQKCLNSFGFNLNDVQGNLHIEDPHTKLLLYRIFKETRINDDTSVLSIQSLLLETLAGLQHVYPIAAKNKPEWVPKLNEILRDRCCEKLSLHYLANTAGIHPVHLSRDFAKYFRCTLGHYTRKLKIERSLSLLSDKNNSLTDITFECGFSDQSHFIRCFKLITDLTPMAYRNMLFG